jgi:hypothetical protein
LILQIALWVYTLEESFPAETHQKLAAATSWLLDLVDPDTGRVPNLGHNDGAYFQPLASCSFHDYRPVLQAAASTFLEEQPFPAGPWDELSLWLGLSKQAQIEDEQGQSQIRINTYPDSQIVVHNSTNHSWACCRVTRYRSRPAHADQLHLDLWWKGLNVAQDAGTFSYNAPSPWANSLVHTAIHNTVTINDRDQMTHAGRFLWLDWAQAQITHHETDPEAAYGQLVAQHDGYHKLGVIHQRSVSTHSTGSWIIEDHLFPSQKKSLSARQIPRQVQDQSGEHMCYHARLHWLLPDWSWELDEDDHELQTNIRLRSPQGWIVLNIGIESATYAQDENKPPLVQLARAGESLIGYGPISPNSGWVSPTYGYKVPALSLAITVETPLPLKFKSLWEFPHDK